MRQFSSGVGLGQAQCFGNQWQQLTTGFGKFGGVRKGGDCAFQNFDGRSCQFFQRAIVRVFSRFCQRADLFPNASFKFLNAAIRFPNASCRFLDAAIEI